MSLERWMVAWLALVMACHCELEVVGTGKGRRVGWVYVSCPELGRWKEM